MLQLLKLIPIVPALVGLLSAGGGVGAGWWAHGFIFDTFTRPAIVREQEAICLERVTAAAEKAKLAEQLRQFRIGERVTNDFLAKEREDAAWAAARVQVIQQEIDNYESQLATDHACALDQRDLDFLGGLRDGSAAH